jgi:hypothetical protein
MKCDNQIIHSDKIESGLSSKQTFDLFNQTGMLFTRSKPRRIISVDPGNVISGFCMIENGQIAFAANLPNQFVIPKIREFIQNAAYTVIIEDVRPYGTRLTQQLLDTSKFIGELCYRLIGLKVVPELIARWEVKKWVFETFKSDLEPLILKKMEKSEKGLTKADGENRKPTFIWVDDRLIIKSMKKMWNIPTPKPGKTNKYGINAHSWQALALASLHITQKDSNRGA